MKHLMKFNESITKNGLNNNLEPLVIDIKDILMELTDDDYGVETRYIPSLQISRIYICIHKVDDLYGYYKNFTFIDIYDCIDRLFNFLGSNFRMYVDIEIAGKDWNNRLHRSLQNKDDWEWSNIRDLFMNGYVTEDSLEIWEKTLVKEIEISITELN
jgi:hypothetical protein